MLVDIGPIAGKILQLVSLYLELRDVGIDIDTALFKAKKLKSSGKSYSVEELISEVDAARIVLYRERVAAGLETDVDAQQGSSGD